MFSSLCKTECNDVNEICAICMLVASLFYTDVTTAEFVQDLIFFLLLLLLSSFVIGKPFLSFNKVSVRVAVFCNVTSVLRSNGK